MTVESATYLSGLSVTNPISTDPRGQGDDHIRLIKSALKNSFPNVNRPVYFDNIVTTVVSDVTITDGADGGKIVPVSASGASRTITLPSIPTEGMALTVYKAEYSPNIVTISGNGKTINGRSTIILSRGYQKARLQYSETLGEWIGDVDHPGLPVGALIPCGAASAYECVLANGTVTIGSATAGGTKAGPEFQALFEHLWNTYSGLSVSSGRGATSVADWNANKRITTPNLCGRAIFGVDNMGGITAAGVLNAYAATSVGAAIGSDDVTLARNQLPKITLDVDLEQEPHSHTYSRPRQDSRTKESTLVGTSEPPIDVISNTSSTTIDITGTVELNNAASQVAVKTVPPGFTSNIYLVQ